MKTRNFPSLLISVNYSIIYLFIHSFLQQISSLREQLLKASETSRSQTERANYLETQCTFLNVKVDNLLQRIAQLNKEGSKPAETITTDGLLKVGCLFHRTPQKFPRRSGCYR